MKAGCLLSSKYMINVDLILNFLMLVLHSHRHRIKDYIFKKPIEMHDNQKICLHKKQQK